MKCFAVKEFIIITFLSVIVNFCAHCVQAALQRDNLYWEQSMKSWKTNFKKINISETIWKQLLFFLKRMV